MTAESSQNAPTVNRQPLGNQQLRVVLVVVVAAVVGVVLWLVLGHNTKKHHPGAGGGIQVGKIGPIKLTENKLAARALTLGQPMYWAGPQPGMQYEFWRLTNDNIYVRYLPKGTKGTPSAERYTIVGTYPFRNAYQGLKKLAKSNAMNGPRGSVIYPRPDDPRSVYIAWPGVNYEVEVFTPRASHSLALAKSGNIITVG